MKNILFTIPLFLFNTYVIADTLPFELTISGAGIDINKSLELSDVGEGKTAINFSFEASTGKKYIFDLNYKELPSNRSYPTNLDVTLKDGDSVVAIDIPEMKQVGNTKTASTPYPVDKAGPLNKIYAITHGDNSIDIINPDTLENLGSIPLQHKPRSGAGYNADLTVQLIAGADKPMSSLIDPFTDTVVAVSGLNEVTTPNGDYGGGLASGHPFWFSKRKFAVIDRSNRSIKLYKLNGERALGFSAEFLDEIRTPTSVHHFVSRKRDALHNDDKYIY